MHLSSINKNVKYLLTQTVDFTEVDTKKPISSPKTITKYFWQFTVQIYLGKCL